LTPVAAVPSSRTESAPPATAKPIDDASRIERTLKSGNAALIALLFVALGVLLAFTPCVLPMLPILSSIIVGQADAAHPASRARGFVLALVYSLGMALVYTLLGVAAGLAGEGLAAELQTPWILGTFAALLVLLSLSMFGFYELQIPTGIQERLARWSGRAGESGGRTSAGRWVGTFAMGALSALIVGPCVAAPLAGALVYIGQTRDIVVGGLALFCLAIGMSVPLLLVGVSAGALLPRAGAWMDTVKHFFGVLLIGVALWMVTPVLPTWVVMVAWGVIAIVAAVFLRVFDTLREGVPASARLAKGLGAVLLLAGAIELIGVATGGRDALQPLAHLARGGDGIAATGVPEGTRLPFETVKSTADLDRRIATAASDGRPVLLDFYADWCVSCKEMERYTYSDARVAERMRDFILLKADVTGNDADDRALLKRFRLFGPPGIVFFDRDGKPLPDASVVGFQDADRFLSSLVAAVPGTKS
jgi:thiol:disulfide interchange protein DsbD